MVMSVCTCRRLLDADGYMYNTGTLFGKFARYFLGNYRQLECGQWAGGQWMGGHRMGVQWMGSQWMGGQWMGGQWMGGQSMGAHLIGCLIESN